MFAGALVSRLVFLISSPDRAWPHSAFYEGDAIVWANWAEAIAEGRAAEFNSGLPFYPPATAYLIAWLGPRGAGLSRFGLKVLWCVMSAAACSAAYLAMAKGVGRRVGLIAGGWCVFSFVLGVLATSLNNETPYLLLVCLLVLLTLRLAERSEGWRGIGLAAVVGVLHGLANLTRAEHTLLLGMMTGYLVLRWRSWGGRGEASAGTGLRGASWGRCAALIGVILACFLTTCLAWSVHATRANIRYNRTVTFRPDYAAMTPAWSEDARAFFDGLPEFCKRGLGAYLYTAVQGRAGPVTAADLRAILLRDFGYVPEPVRAFTLVSSAGPLSFALANHPAARGGFSKAALDARFSPDAEIELSLPTHLRLYNRGWRAGLEWIAADPAAWARNSWLKLANFWSGVTTGLTTRNLPYGRAGERRPVDMMTHEPGAAIWWRTLVTVLIGAGVVVAVRRRVAGLWLVVMAYKVIVTLLFFGYARQAASILPAFYLLGALGVDGLVRLVEARGRAWRRLSVGTGAAAVVGLAVLDLSVPRSGAVPRIEGFTRPSERWGPGAFESVAPIRIEYRPAPARGGGGGSSGPSTEGPTGTGR